MRSILLWYIKRMKTCRKEAFSIVSKIKIKDTYDETVVIFKNVEYRITIYCYLKNLFSFAKL